jgi:protein SCO1/2
VNRSACCAFLCALAIATGAHAHLTPADGAQRAGFDQRLSAQIPPALAFRDEADRGVRFGDYLGATPIVLVFAWYGCTTLCPTVVGNVAAALARSGLAPGSYRVLVASIDPRDAPADALRMKRRYLEHANADAGAWHLLTGSGEQIAALTHAAGFRYAYDDETHQYAHPAGVVLLTPQGTIARYFFGFDFTPAALHDAVEAAAADEIGSPVERLLLVCFHFAPSGKYSALVLQALRMASVALLVAGLALFIAIRRRTAAR